MKLSDASHEHAYEYEYVLKQLPGQTKPNQTGSTVSVIIIPMFTRSFTTQDGILITLTVYVRSLLCHCTNRHNLLFGTVS